jgi:gliding motility-associated-like protein
MPGSLSGSTVNVCPTNTTTYTVTGTSAAGCTNSAAVTVTVNPKPTVTANATSPSLCSGECTNLNASGASSYVWMPGSLSGPTVNICPTSNTTYTVTGTSAAGCTNTATVSVTVNPSPNVSITTPPPTICNGQCTSLTATGATTYTWMPGSLPGSSVSICPTTTTTYTVTGTTGACSNAASITVTVNPSPTANAGTDINIGACLTAPNATLNGSGTGTPPLTYSWSPTTGLNNPNISNPVADPTANTTYTLTVTNGYGCTATDAVSVTIDPLPSANAGTDQSIGACNSAANANLNGSGTGTSPLSYSWTPTNGLSNPNISNPVADPNITTNYTLTVTDAYGCTASDAVLITVNNLPSANAGSDQNIGACANAANANLNGSGTGTGPLSYSWIPTDGLSNPNISNPVADPSSTTTYTLTVTDIYGCTATDTVLITVNPIPTVNAGADQNIGACASADNANLNGSATGTEPFAYSWVPITGLSNPNSANTVADPTVTTIYTLVVTDAYGCTATDDITVIVNPLPTANAGPDQNIGACGNASSAYISGSGTGIAPLSFSWVPVTGLNDTNISNPVADPSVTTTYTLTVTDAYGCTATDDIIISIDDLPTANAGQDQTIGGCTNAANASINASATGITPLVISWLPTTGLNDPTILNPVADPSVTTTYTLTVTDAYGCTATDDITITLAPLPTIDAGPDQNIGACLNAANANINAIGTGATPLTYSWSPTTGLNDPNISNPVANPATSTVYVVTLTDVYGCSVTDDIAIIVDSLPTSYAGTDQSIGACLTSPAANLNGSGSGTGPLVYSWLPTTGVADPNTAVTTAHPTNTTVYTLTVTDLYGCTATDAINVIVDPAPVANAGPDAVIGTCSWSMANLNGSATGSTPFGYSWLPTQGLTNSYIPNPQAHPFTTTVYTLTITDIYGCTAADFVTVTVTPLPNVTAIANPSTICEGFSTTINANGTLTYNWSPGTGLSSTTGQSVVANPLATTTYTVTGSDQFTCTGSTQVTINVNPNPVLTISPPAPAICYGGNVTLTADGASSYSWNPSIGLSQATGPVVSAFPNSTITYTLTGTTLGCTSTASVTVTVNPLPIVSFSPFSQICLNDLPFSINLGSPPGGIYTGEGITGTDNFDPALAGVGSHLITYTYTDDNNCTNSASQYATVKPSPILTITPPSASLCLGTSVLISASGADSYSWSPSNTLSSATGTPVTATPTEPTTYTLVGDIDGCTASEGITVNTYTTIPITITPPRDSICPGSSVILTASGGTQYTWEPPDGLNTNIDTVVIATPEVTTFYTVYASDNDGCTGTQTVAIVLYPEAFLHFTETPREGCVPLNVNFEYLPDSTLYMNTLMFNFGDLMSTTDYSTQPVCSYTYTYHGIFMVSLTAISVHGCHAVGYDTVFAYKSTVANFYTKPEVAETDNPLFLFYDESMYADQWLWNFGDPASDDNNTSTLQYPQHVYGDSGHYVVMLIASNDYNCSDTAFRIITVNESFAFYVPNSFTPNEDGKNDYFLGKGVGFREDEFEMYIFDRWGKMLFYTKDFSEGWDGYNPNGVTTCSEGIYVWLINVRDDSGIWHILKGTVTLNK